MSENSSLLIKGGRIIDPSSGHDAFGDLLIEGGIISAIEKPGQIPDSRAKKVIPASGKWVLPGLIDAHVHLREPGMEYKETIASGTRAAVSGGFTSVACMANTQPVNDTPYVTAFIRERAKQTAACRVFPIGAASKGLKGEEIAEIGGMIAEGARAISDDGMPIMNSYMMRKVMDYSKAFGVAVISHAEDSFLVGQGAINESAYSNSLGLRGNPAAAEEILVARDIALCRLTRCRLHFAHITTELALEHIRRAKDAGLPVTAEASPHHLLLSEEAVVGYDTNFKMSPPLRGEKDVAALRKALRDGSIDLIATDHAPHGVIEKAVEFDQAANGIIGLETAVAATLKLVHEGALPVMRWVESLTTRPAQLLGIPYGTLKVGSAADVTLIDPDQIWTILEKDIVSKSQNTPFLNQKFKGRVVATILDGKIAYAIEQEGDR
ncbi:MAG: dihydroorotase [Bdellovibrionales bacterium GWB1_55_8]|nr:MAG: dihydroorotase [Bdellovibrionales bacterium GWB1_55_8]